MSSAIKRLTKDYLEYQANSEEFTLISAEPLENNLFEWHVNICAPDGPYANLPLHFILNFPDNYPAAPPKVKLCTRIAHPNVFENWGDNGAWICLDMLKEYTVKTKYEGWSSVYTLTSILLQLQSFLFSENVPQDYGGGQSLSYGNHSVCSSLNRIKSFKCSCGHTHDRPMPRLPKGYYKLLNTSVWKSGAKIIASKGAVVNQNTVFWQEFPAWKQAAWDCGSLMTDAGYPKFMYEVKIDWGWNGFYREDIRIGWGVLTGDPAEGLNYKVIDESPADVGTWYWPQGMKVGDILTTAIDLQRKKVWYAVNGKLLPVRDYAKNPLVGEHLVPIFRFRACRLLLNFETPTKLIPRFRDAGFRLLEPKCPIASPLPAVAEWKQDREACADVFPPQVFQVIIEFLPMSDIINARASCASIRSLIEEAAIIPRREVHCFVTKNTWKEATLGVGLSCTKNDKLTLEEVKPNMEFLSLDEWKNGHRASAWGEELTDFLVLPISRTHCSMNLLVEYMEKFGANYRLGGGHSPSEILNILSKLMNMCVVTMMKETQGGKCNEKLLVGYCQFHHLLLALNERYPAVAELAQKRVRNFIHKDAGRHKKETPDLGKLLVMASLCPNLDWKKFMDIMFKECCRRRVMWYLKSSGALANIDTADDVYCQRVFEETEISRGVVAFQVAFLKTFALPKEGQTLSDVLSNYFLRYGQPRSADMAALFKRAKEIVNCKTWKEHLIHVDLEMTGLQLAHYLKSAVAASLKANYHRNQRNFGKGKVKCKNGKGACAGLFRISGKSATECDNKVKCWLPKGYFKELKEIAHTHQAKLSLPSVKPFTGPITVASNTSEGLKAVKVAIKRSFPYLSLIPMKPEYFELSFEDVGAQMNSLKNAARKCCVDVKFPKQFGFPITMVLGSKQGIQKYHEALQYYLQRPVLRKFSLKTHTLCERCDMTFPALHGASIRAQAEAMSIKLEKHDESTYAWGGHWNNDMRITKLVEGGIWEGLGLEEGMKISDIKPNVEALVAGEACTFTAQHDCGFVCRFCWPAMQKENKGFFREKRDRFERKEHKAKMEKIRVEKVEAIKAKAKKNVDLPAPFLTFRNAKVRQGYSLDSDEVGIVSRAAEVMVVEIVNNRARISSPLKGWVSLATKHGMLLDLVNNSRAFPALGAVKVFREATISYQEEKKKAALSKKVAVKKQSATWDCKVCGTTGCFASRNSCFKCGAPKKNSVSSVWNSKGKPVLQSSAVSVKSASSSDSGSSKSISVSKPATPIKSGKSYTLNRTTALQQSKDRTSKWIANLNANSKVYVDYVDHKNWRARITSPMRGWISTWTKDGRLLK